MTERVKKRELEEVSMKKIFSVVVLVALLVMPLCGFAQAQEAQITLNDISQANLIGENLRECGSMIYQNICHSLEYNGFSSIETTFIEHRDGRFAMCSYYSPEGTIIVYKDGFGYIKYADEILVTELYLMDSYDRSVASFFEESSLVEFGSDERNISITKDDDSYSFHVEFLLKDAAGYEKFNSEWGLPEDTVIIEEGELMSEGLRLVNLRDFYITSSGEEVTLLNSMMEYSPVFSYPDFVDHLQNPSAFNEITVKFEREGQEHWSRTYRIAKDSLFYAYLDEGYALYFDEECTKIYDYKPLQGNMTLYIGCEKDIK